MRQREFNQKLAALCTKEGGRTRLDLTKVRALPDDEKAALVTHIASQPVRNAGIVKELIPDSFDRSWLASMGFLYTVRTERYELLCTGTHPLLQL